MLRDVEIAQGHMTWANVTTQARNPAREIPGPIIRAAFSPTEKKPRPSPTGLGAGDGLEAGPATQVAFPPTVALVASAPTVHLPPAVTEQATPAAFDIAVMNSQALASTAVYTQSFVVIEVNSHAC